MKMVKQLLAIVVALIGFAALASELTGYGQSVTVATGTATVVNFPKAAFKAVIVNNGTNSLYALANCTAAEFAAAIVAGAAIIVPATAAIGNPYTFDGSGNGQRSISAIYLQSVTGNNAVLVQGY